MGRRRFIQATAALASGIALAGAGSQRRLAPTEDVRSSLEAADPPPRLQAGIPVPALDPELAVLLRRANQFPACDNGQLVALSYHIVFADELSPAISPNPFSVTASQLASHLSTLRTMGFRSVRLADVIRARRLGRPMPAKSVLLTFDDGSAGQWTHADAVLRRFGFSAVTFLITGYVGTAPEFLTWNEVRAMVASGRWEVGDHTHRDHHTVPAGPSLRMQTALINRAWNPRSRTLETLPAAEARVSTDFDLSFSALRRERLERPVAFAYPFSSVEGPTNDPVLTEFTEELAARLFPLRFTNFSPGRLVAPQDLAVGLLPRFEVHRHVDALQLYEQIRAADMKAARSAGRPISGGFAGGV
jgi:poly-beta-1,6-N-acetyl-D-glucosamine N-deacetylase